MPSHLVFPVLALSLAAPSALGAAEPTAEPNTSRIYVGTYTEQGRGGIHAMDFNPLTGALTRPRLAAETENPSFLAAHPTQPVLYAVNENDRFDGAPGGGVTAFAVEPGHGSLQRLNARNTGGAHPCHLAVDQTGQFLAVANYTGGNVALFRLLPDGRLGDRTSLLQHTGSGPNLNRQKEPHPHGTYFTLDSTLLVPDLGTDRVLAYRIDTEGALAPVPGATLALRGGTGPRHLAAGPRPGTFYILGELTSTISLCGDPPAANAGAQEISTLPPACPTPSTAAEIAVHPNKRFLYASNRGHDSLAVFDIASGSGRLSHVTNTPTGGRTPRHFALDPSGRWLVAANQDSNSLQVFSVDASTGRLTASGPAVSLPKPVCVLFTSPVSASRPPARSGLRP